MEILKNPHKLPAVLERLAQGAQGILFCDYDGTLAPFCEDSRKALPYPWVPGLLEELKQIGTRVVLVTGRLLEDIKTLLPVEGIEVWGSHGRERVGPHCGPWKWEGDSNTERLLTTLFEALRAAWPNVRMERKVGCLAIHFRGLTNDEVSRLVQWIDDLCQQYDSQGTLKRKDFHLGLELQLPGPTKGDAVRTVLAEVKTPQVAAAFLGDDTTDEDAFRALGDAGLSVLVSPVPRETFADVRLEGESEVRDFFCRWLDAAKKGGDYDE